MKCLASVYHYFFDRGKKKEFSDLDTVVRTSCSCYFSSLALSLSLAQILYLHRAYLRITSAGRLPYILLLVVSSKQIENILRIEPDLVIDAVFFFFFINFDKYLSGELAHSIMEDLVHINSIFSIPLSLSLSLSSLVTACSQ